MDSLKEHILKIISNKIKMTILAKFLSIEQYNSDILNDFSDVQRKGANNLYEKYIVYYEKPTIKFDMDSNGDILDILKETIELEKAIVKKIGTNFGIRQSLIHTLSDDEKFHYHLKKLLK
ncbi:MAG TPA: hypothetical protein EYG76_03875 [Methanothermococcus okinawensis]|uniref:Uncharacterized protein n=1 Tax=Methanothermococcus okinawensis TaxID=155863 RepID=A0A832YTS6_9EURY|nr:hypothetical protein [Methanothermococcus okinawensis]